MSHEGVTLYVTNMEVPLFKAKYNLMVSCVQSASTQRAASPADTKDREKHTCMQTTQRDNYVNVLTAGIWLCVCVCVCVCTHSVCVCVRPSEGQDRNSCHLNRPFPFPTGLQREKQAQKGWRCKNMKQAKKRGWKVTDNNCEGEEDMNSVCTLLTITIFKTVIVKQLDMTMFYFPHTSLKKLKRVWRDTSMTTQPLTVFPSHLQGIQWLHYSRDEKVIITIKK